ncbi:MAG: (Fe-S)-binding protein [Acidobacteriaceae bacterium]|nr:(Fe-S)-binding protein [Acidobacteriaceae bacterium]
MRVSIFITCYNDTLFPKTGKAVVTVLERLGHAVDFNPDQTCCGQMHYNTGYQRAALPLMKHFIRVFSDAEVICIPSSSCVAMMKDHYPKIAAATGDRTLIKQVEAVLPRVYEFSELLVDKLGVTEVGAFYPHVVTLHPSCHSLRSLHLGNKPKRLLHSVRGLTLVDLPEDQQCCGFGGTFAIKNADVSAAMLSEKIRCVLNSRAEVCAAVDNSCLMHIGGGLGRQRAGIRCVHLAEILASIHSEAEA